MTNSIRAFIVWLPVLSFEVPQQSGNGHPGGWPLKVSPFAGVLAMEPRYNLLTLVYSIYTAHIYRYITSRDVTPWRVMARQNSLSILNMYTVYHDGIWTEQVIPSPFVSDINFWQRKP